MNVVMLRGTLVRPAEERLLPSGTRVVSFEVAAEEPSGASGVVPVNWPEGRYEDLEPGAEVVVTGAVRRRFFRVGGATQSRTEVVADAVVPVAARRRVRAALDRALAAVER